MSDLDFDVESSVVLGVAPSQRMLGVISWPSLNQFAYIPFESSIWLRWASDCHLRDDNGCPRLVVKRRSGVFHGMLYAAIVQESS